MWRFIKRQWYKLFNYGESTWTMSYKGKFRVRYPDGKESMRFDWKTAKTYQSIFGGQIIDAD